MSTDTTASNEHLVALLESGTRMIKVPSKLSSKMQERLIRLDMAHDMITWESKKKEFRLSHLLLSSIKEVRAGPHTKSFTIRGIPPQQAHFCFSIIYVSDGKYRTLDLIALNKSDYRAWYEGLLAILSIKNDKWHDPSPTSASEEIQLQLKVLWKNADMNNDGGLDIAETTALLRTLNMSISKTGIKPVFKQFCTDSVTKRLNFEQFEQLFLSLKYRPEIASLFSSIVPTKDHQLMPLDAFSYFIKTVQNMPASDEKIESWFAKYAVCDEFGINQGLSMSSFTSFLLSSHNQLFKKEHAQVYMDMSRPLQDYYIASSHNTYLLGDQLTSESSVEAYIRVLQRGCRCVELDAWDGPNGEPVVYHGRTLTTKITFRSVIAAIAKYAFVSSPYPLILSLENHCSFEQQVVMARALTLMLGDSLLMSLLDIDGAVPSPEVLQHKIILKAKKLNALTAPSRAVVSAVTKAAEGNSDSDSGNESGGDNDSLSFESRREKDEAVDPDGKRLSISSMKKFKKRFLPSFKSSSSTGLSTVSAGPPQMLNLSGMGVIAAELGPITSPSDSPGTSSPLTASSATVPSVKGHSTAQELSDLVVYFKALHFKGFDAMLPSITPDYVCSISEKKAKELYQKSLEAFQQFNKTAFTRIYPAGLRLKSSNYEPHWLWICGCQLVALNYQTFDKGMQINKAQFLGNGGCGYVLKPESLLQDAPPKSAGGSNVVTAVTITIISAQQLPKPKGLQFGEIIDPYVELDLVGPECDQVLFRTNVVANNGFNPMWNETVTLRVSEPEFSFLRFQVFDMEVTARNQIVGSYTIAFRDLNTGFRHVPLYDGKGELLAHATLFVKINTKHVPVRLFDKRSNSNPSIDTEEWGLILSDKQQPGLTNVLEPRAQLERLASKDELLKSRPVNISSFSS